ISVAMPCATIRTVVTVRSVTGPAIRSVSLRVRRLASPIPLTGTALLALTEVRLIIAVVVYAANINFDSRVNACCQSDRNQPRQFAPVLIYDADFVAFPNQTQMDFITHIVLPCCKFEIR